MSSSGLDLGLYFLVIVVLASPLSGNANCNINPTERLSASAATTRHLREDTITIGPKTTTGYVGGNISANATIPLPDSCTGPIIFINDYKLSAPCTNLLIYGADGLEHLLYTINGVQESVDGTRIDVCIFCGDHYECFSPAYFYVKGRPNITKDDILIKVTCNEVMIMGSIDKDATLKVEIKDSSNVTIYKEEGLTLPHSVNGSLFNPRNEYQLSLVANNKAGDSNPLIYGFDFDVNVTADFDIGNAAVKYLHDTVKLFLNITVNESCPLFIPDHLNMESSCLAGGHTLLYLNESFSFLLDLLMDQQECAIVVSSITTKKEALVDTSRILNIRIWPRVTSNGYYSINATLLNGVTGVMTQVLYLNGTVYFNQSIPRNYSHDYAVANSSSRLPNGTFIITVYPLLSDGRSFDSSYTEMNFSITCIMTDDSSEGTPTGEPGKRNVPIWVIVIALIFVIILIIAIIVAILLGVRHRGRIRQWTPNRDEEGRGNVVSEGGGGGDDGGGGGDDGERLRGINGGVDDIEIDNVVANRDDDEINNNIEVQAQVDNEEDKDDINESVNTPPPPLHNGEHKETATADKHRVTATADSTSVPINLTQPTQATCIEVEKEDGPVISAVQSYGPETPQDSSEVNSWSNLLPQNDVPPKSKWNIFKKKNQGHGQPVAPDEGSDQSQGDVFSLAEPIADAQCETNPNFVPGMVRQGSTQVDDLAALSQQVFISPNSSLNTRQLN